MIQSVLPSPGECALRAVVCLAAPPPDGWMTARDLAEQANVPPAFLAKVLRRRVQHGLLEAHKVHHGGFRLARHPASVRVIDVLEAADIELKATHCDFGFVRCNEALPCAQHEMHRDLQLMCNTWARANTLVDIDLSRIPRLLLSPERVAG